MHSRLLIGATGWLLGAVTATAGSLYAVDQLGQGLLAQHTKRVSVAMVNTELAQENSAPRTAGPTQAATGSPRPSTSRKSGAHKPSSQQHQRAAGVQATFSTTGGTAEAVCKHGQVWLLYEIPGQGYNIDDPQPGPSSAASVTFTNSSGGVVLRVTCSSAGAPVSHVSAFSWGAGSHHDD